MSLWPAAECTHPLEYRRHGGETTDEQGELIHQWPEYCCACGYAIAPPREAGDG
jgi:hypothetical protein